MRCKPNDIVVMVGGETENIGIFLRVLECEVFEEFGPAWTFEEASRPVAMWGCGAQTGSTPSTRVRSTLEDPAHEARVIDSDLRPIRDQPGADETLLWAGLPADAKREVA